MAVTYSSAEAIANVPGATMPVLRARFRKLANVVDSVGAERQAIHAEMRRRENDGRIQLRLDAMTKPERQAAKTLIEAMDG